jgi:hypothetical protein
LPKLKLKFCLKPKNHTTLIISISIVLCISCSPHCPLWPYYSEEKMEKKLPGTQFSIMFHSCCPLTIPHSPPLNVNIDEPRWYVPQTKRNCPKSAPIWDTLGVRSIMGAGLPCCSRQVPCCWGSIPQGEWSLVGVMNLASSFFFGVRPSFCYEFAVMLKHAIKNSTETKLNS